ncbi:MAG: SIS domain-containing protein [Planctomycetes bacterium]|nr:SIS domain-containing protein [Planctomycetota bacterium]
MKDYTFLDYYRIIAGEISAVLKKTNENAVEKFIKRLKGAKKIYIAGVGRSGLIIKAFGQRLMHLGFDVHLADEITAPAITKEDLLICCSATGKTQLILFMAKKARMLGSYVVTFTATKRSSLVKYSNQVILIPSSIETQKGVTLAKSKARVRTIQPARSLFEQAMFLLFDAVIMRLLEVLRVTPSKVTKRHANLE